MSDEASGVVGVGLNALLGRMRLLEQDHEPDGWPAVQMRDISALCDAVQQCGFGAGCCFNAAEIDRLHGLIAAHVSASNNDDSAGDTFGALMDVVRSNSEGNAPHERD